MTILKKKNLEKNFSKKFASEIRKKKLSKKKLKINFFFKKIFFNGHLEGNAYGELKNF